MSTVSSFAPCGTALPAGRTPEAPDLARGQRLHSLDALRGFDMFWIMGGETLAAELSKYTQWGWVTWLSGQMHHPDWHGFAFYDLIFPLFLFISGVTMPLSLRRRREAGEGAGVIYFRIFRRAVLLIFLGMVVNGFLKFDWANNRYPSVLGRIGLGYFFAAIIVLNTRVRGQALWLIGLLAGYWLAILLVPVPGFGRGNLTLEGWLGGYIDRSILPGRLYRGVHDPEGLFATIPAIGTALLGALAGQWLTARRSAWIKVPVMLAAGGLLLALGRGWNTWFPINKNMWSSSFVLYAGGWSLLFLALFYLVIDVWRLRRWAFVFVVIGVNPITIYMIGRVINFPYAADFLFGGAIKHYVSPAAQALATISAVLLLKWLLLYFLYRKRVFLRV